MSDDVSRALATVRALTHRRIYDRSRHLWRRTTARATALRRHRDYDHLWPYANAWSAIGAVASLPGDPGGCSGLLERFPAAVRAYGGLPHGAATGEGIGEAGFSAAVVAPLGHGGQRYFDDNAWVGLAAARQAAMTGSDAALAVARATFSFAASGWSAQFDAVHPGGVRWKESAACRTRHTCATAPAAQLAAALHLLTGDEEALGWGRRAYAWVRRALADRDGLYADRIAPDGTVETTRWSYNQGAMIGAGVLLHRATADTAYLEEAHGTALAALAYFDPPVLARQGAPFNGIYFRNLALLATESGDPALRGGVRASAAACAEDAWIRARDGRTGLFAGGRSALNATAPIAELHALLAGASPAW